MGCRRLQASGHSYPHNPLLSLFSLMYYRTIFSFPQPCYRSMIAVLSVVVSSLHCQPPKTPMTLKKTAPQVCKRAGLFLLPKPFLPKDPDSIYKGPHVVGPDLCPGTVLTTAGSEHAWKTWPKSALKRVFPSHEALVRLC